MFKELILKHSIEIKTTPEAIWEFFLDIEHNYKKWHPKDHILFKWTKGRPDHENAKRTINALADFGFSSLDLTIDDFQDQNKVIQLGLPPA